MLRKSPCLSPWCVKYSSGSKIEVFVISFSSADMKTILVFKMQHSFLTDFLSNLQVDTNAEQILPVGTNLPCISMSDRVSTLGWLMNILFDAYQM